ncbi:MAG: inositol-3-phosphate synthase [Planctomycetota bacterium]
MPERTGVWIIGARGGVATTAIVGALALRSGKTQSYGLITETDLCDKVPFPRWDQLVFGGHDIRSESLNDSARQIYHDTNTLGYELLTELADDLDAVDEELRPGVLYQSGRAIESLAAGDSVTTQPAAKCVAQIRADLDSFRERHQLQRVVVVNLSSTEPTVPNHPDHATAAGIEKLLAADAREALIASSLYAWAAAEAGCAYINFTPSPGALLPGIAEKFASSGLPFMGSDGKTGETLVKSALAPMFKYRNLRILAWQGYNMLGDRDGQVLASEQNCDTKVSSKDQMLRSYLGYPVDSQVRIDYVPSLNDLKTAWDFIHFEGFLGYKMSLQFTWQGCDAILAAPLVLDMVRLSALALSREERGAMKQMAVFFKQPHDTTEHDLHQQFHALAEYLHNAKE